MSRSHSSAWMRWTIAFLALICICAAVLLIVLTAYPLVARSVTAQLYLLDPRLVELGGALGERTRTVAEHASAGYRYRIEPLFASLRSKQPPSKTATGSKEETQGFPAETCDSCHPYWRERPLFTKVYMPHALHAEKGVECSRCHDSAGPGRDTVPSMKICTDCHEQARSGSGKCGTCHPPGSLFHGAQLAGSREIGEQCATCHQPSRISRASRTKDLPGFDRRASSCGGCHTQQSCNKCHPASHASGYASRHFKDFRNRSVSLLSCYRCHESAWCASRCHSARR
jgi:hypothetical protein